MEFIRLKMKLAPLIFALCRAECPCKEIGEELDFGKVIVNNEHADQERGHKFYAHVHTPVGPVQQDEYTFILKFNQPVTNFNQHNFLADFTDGGEVAMAANPYHVSLPLCFSRALSD